MILEKILPSIRHTSLLKMQLQNCEVGELVILRFGDSTVLTIAGLQNGSSRELIHLNEIRGKYFEKLPYSEFVDPFVYECLSYGKDWIFEIKHSKDDQILEMNEDLKLGVAIATDGNIGISVLKKMQNNRERTIFMSLDNFQCKPSSPMSVVSENWNLWLSEKDMKDPKKSPFLSSSMDN